VFIIEIAKMGIEAVKQNLIAVNQGDIRSDGTLHICLERMIMLHALDDFCQCIIWSCSALYF